MTTLRGNVYDLAIPLAGAPLSGLSHHAFAVSNDKFAQANQKVVLISTTTGSTGQVRAPFAFFIKDSVYTHERGRPFLTERPITPTLLATVPLGSLRDRVGYVSDTFFTGSGCTQGYGANDAIRVQLQLPGRMHALAKLYRNPQDVSNEALTSRLPVERLSIWSVQGQRNPWIIVSNDKHNLKTGYVQGMEVLSRPCPYPQTELSPDDTTYAKAPRYLGANLCVFRKKSASASGPDTLESNLGTVCQAAASKVDAHLMNIFGL